MKAYEKIAVDEEKKKIFLRNYIKLKKIYTLASPHPETIKIKDDIMFFEMIKKMIIRYQIRSIREVSRDIEYEMHQLISKSISAQEPIDILSLILKEKPTISIPDDEFLNRIKNLEYKNYVFDVLYKILENEINPKLRINPYRYEKFSKMLKETIEKYNAKIIETAQAIDELIEIAKKYKIAYEEAKKLNLRDDELAFYDMLNSEKIFNDERIAYEVAKEITKEISSFVIIPDWDKKQNIRSKLRTKLKDILIKRNYINYSKIEELSKNLEELAKNIYFKVQNNPLTSRNSFHLYP